MNSFPAAGSSKFLQHPTILAFAHRGGGGELPENTLPAFQRAVDLGYQYLETDVHATADGVVVAFHDSVLDRVTNRSGKLHSLPWSEVSKARIAGIEKIPLLTDILECFPNVRINIDPKHDSVLEPLANILKSTKSIDRVCIGSFSNRRIKEIRKLLGAELCTSAGTLETIKFRTSVMGIGLKIIPYQCLQVPVSYGPIKIVTKQFVDKAHESSLQVHVWTVDDPNEMNELIDLGVDGLMTDYPEILRKVLITRNLWV